MNRMVLFNGGVAPELALHRALHYGDGVFRTCLIFGSQIIDIEEQCNLVIADAARLGLAGVVPEQLAGEARQLAIGQGTGVLKIMLLRAGSARGYRPATAVTDRLLCRLEAPAYRAAAWEQGVNVFRSPLPLSSQPALAGIKHLNRLEQVLASRDWDAQSDEALLTDDEGHPVCGTRTNLFWIAGTTLQTPPLDRCGVAGHMRRKVMALAAALRLECRERHGRWEDLEAADEVFLTNSLIGIWPVARLSGRRWTAPGPVTRGLMEQLAHPRWAQTGGGAA